MSKPLTPEAKVAAAAGPQNVRAAQTRTQTNTKVALAAGCRPPSPSKKR